MSASIVKLLEFSSIWSMMSISMSKQKLVLESLEDEDEGGQSTRANVSNVWLQLSLFLNLCYFPVWLAMTTVTTSVKYVHLNYLYKFILLTILAAIVVVETLRLYLGYLGNLTEKVPELAGFWLLTLLLQLPMQLFLFLNEELLLLPMERAANLIMVTMVVAQLLLGFHTLYTMSRHQAKRFELIRRRMMADMHKQS